MSNLREQIEQYDNMLPEDYDTHTDDSSLTYLDDDKAMSLLWDLSSLRGEG